MTNEEPLPKKVSELKQWCWRKASPPEWNVLNTEMLLKTVVNAGGSVGTSPE